jgi:peptidoglycan/xylan/chitin deacetylase (PgdA/CDA1 family)
MNENSYPIILTYHSIAAGDSPLRIPPALFTEQMEWLKAHAEVMPLGRIVKPLATGGAIPERAVALTFDDGFLDFA